MTKLLTLVAIPHYRKSHGVTLVCQAIWRANHNPFDQVPLALVKKIDKLAKDECERRAAGGSALGHIFASTRGPDWPTIRSALRYRGSRREETME
jgi:hypothetical protein